MTEKVKEVGAEKSEKDTLKKEEKKDELFEVFKVIIDALKDGGEDEAKKKNAGKAISSYIQNIISKDQIYDKYNIVIYYDFTSLAKSDADNIYSAVSKFSEKKPLLMILHSFGGEIGAAYLIGKMCREYSNGKFVIVVPRLAKSAATLLACAADEMHMGSMSELGPIDPQINEMPVLGLKNSIEHISQLVTEHPAAAEMFAKYLKDTVRPIDIGYYERVAESAMQYAERLLSTHKATLLEKPENIAKTLVYTYKDHGFVIDKSEAQKLFGENTVKINTVEYEAGEKIYSYLKTFRELSSIFDYGLVYNGSLEEGVGFIKKK